MINKPVKAPLCPNTGDTLTTTATPRSRHVITHHDVQAHPVITEHVVNMAKKLVALH